MKLYCYDRSPAQLVGNYGAHRPSRPWGALIHTTDGRNSLEWLTGGALREGKPASADYLISRPGTIYALIPRGGYAFHAGNCKHPYSGKTTSSLNHELVGIELENYDRGGEFPALGQHIALAMLLAKLAQHYDWSPLDVFSHGQLAIPMGRRNDPRGLNWGNVFWLMAFGRDQHELVNSHILEGR